MTKRLLMMLGLLLLGGCATLVSPTPSARPSSTPTQPSPLATPTPTGLPSPLTSPLATPLPEGNSAQVDQARADLATRLNVSADQIQLVSSDEVDWPDASAGCPKRGVLYIQVITPGYRIVLSANGQRYEYHSRTSEPPFLCEPQ